MTAYTTAVKSRSSQTYERGLMTFLGCTCSFARYNTQQQYLNVLNVGHHMQAATMRRQALTHPSC